MMASTADIPTTAFPIFSVVGLNESDLGPVAINPVNVIAVIRSEKAGHTFIETVNGKQFRVSTDFEEVATVLGAWIAGGR